MSRHKLWLIRPGNIFQPVIVQFWWFLRNCCPSLLLWADKRGAHCGVLLLRGLRWSLLHTWLTTMRLLVSVAFMSSASQVTLLWLTGFLWPRVVLRTVSFLLFRKLSVNSIKNKKSKFRNISLLTTITKDQPVWHQHHAIFKVSF